MYDGTVKHSRFSAFRSSIGDGDIALRLRGHIGNSGLATILESGPESSIWKNRRISGRHVIRATFGLAKGEGHETGRRRCDLSFLRTRSD